MEIDSLPSRDDSDDNVNLKQHTAAQACETCRARKTKCDEDRPRCAVCRRLNVACNYREPKPTKKDKTLLHILESLRSLESRFDRFESQWNALSPPPNWHDLPAGTQRSNQSTTPQVERNENASIEPRLLPGGEEAGLNSTNWTFSSTSLNTPTAVPFGQKIEARKLLGWPAIHTLLQSDILQIPAWDGENDGGEKWLTRISNECESPLPNDESLKFSLDSEGPSQQWDTGPVHLTKSVIESLCDAFFRSFHTIYPILDRRYFYSDTLPEAYSSSFDQNDGCAALVLLVLALGALAKEGVSGKPILDESTGRSTGIRGGTRIRPPGLAFWNEATRRLGRMLSKYDLNLLQSFILLSIYYSQCSRNMDYWHMTSISCALCQNIAMTVDEWKSFDGDVVARSYWMCVLLEGGLISELGMAPTGITELENIVPLPLFLTNSLPGKSNSDEDLFIEYHFLAQITLRALLNRINTSLRYYVNPFQVDGIHEFPPKTLILELARQLLAWREHLPQVLNWNDENPDSGIETRTNPSVWQQTFLGERSTSNVFRTQMIMNASLRTRYKYAQYLLWRPYVYKVLHFPHSSTEEDIQGCAEAFKVLLDPSEDYWSVIADPQQACSMWPLSYPVFQDQRRLVPHIYEYSHAFFGILVLMHSSLCSPALIAVLESLEADHDLELSKAYMLRWMRDMRVIHPVARWCWQLLKVIYRDHPQVKDVVP